MPGIEDRLRDLERLRENGAITDDELQERRKAVLAQYTASRPKNKGGRIFIWGLMGCVGILAAIGLAVVAVGGRSSGTDAHAAFAQGASATVSTAGSVKLKLTISKITDPATSSNEFEQPKSGDRWVTIALVIENVGSAGSDGGAFTLRTKDGSEYDQTYVSGIGANDLRFLEDLISGDKRNGVVAFDIPQAAKVDWLKFVPNPNAKGDLYFDNK